MIMTTSHIDRVGISATVKQTVESFEKTPANERLLAPLLFLKTFVDAAVYQGSRNQKGDPVNRRGEGVVTQIEDAFADAFLEEGDCQNMKVFTVMMFLEEIIHEEGTQSFKPRDTSSGFWIESSWNLMQDTITDDFLTRETSNYMKAKGTLIDAVTALESIKFKKEHSDSMTRPRCFLKFD